jgi:hypothetical protein
MPQWPLFVILAMSGKMNPLNHDNFHGNSLLISIFREPKKIYSF